LVIKKSADRSADFENTFIGGLSKKSFYVVSKRHMWRFETTLFQYLLARGCLKVLLRQPPEQSFSIALYAPRPA
jgi:hypothetical protein